MGVFSRSGKNGTTWYIDYYMGDRRHVEAVGPKRKEAEAALGKIRAAIREGRYFDMKRVTPITFEDMADKFSEWLTANRKSDGWKYNLPPAKEYFGARLLADITEHDVESYKMLRRDAPAFQGTGKKRPRAGSTVNHEIAILKQLFNKAIAWGYLERQPGAGVKKLPEGKGRERYLTLDESKALLSAASPHLRPIILTALETGMRRGEILKLTWEDVDFRSGTLYVAEAKNGDPRHVPMSNRLRAMLAALPRNIRGKHLFTGTPKIKKTVQIGKPGEPFRDVDTSFENACAKAGITGFRFHDLRHTAASHMAMAGVPLKTIGEILGHKTAAMTERYSHLSPGHKKNAVEMLPDWEAGESSNKIATNGGQN